MYDNQKYKRTITNDGLKLPNSPEQFIQSTRRKVIELYLTNVFKRLCIPIVEQSVTCVNKPDITATVILSGDAPEIKLDVLTKLSKAGILDMVIITPMIGPYCQMDLLLDSNIKKSLGVEPW